MRFGTSRICKTINLCYTMERMRDSSNFWGELWFRKAGIFPCYRGKTDPPTDYDHIVSVAELTCTEQSPHPMPHSQPAASKLKIRGSPQSFLKLTDGPSSMFVKFGKLKVTAGSFFKCRHNKTCFSKGIFRHLSESYAPLPYCVLKPANEMSCISIGLPVYLHDSSFRESRLN